MNAQDLKNSILQLAVQGKLVEQRAEEGTARELLEQIKLEKEQLIKDKKIKKSKSLPEITEEEIPFEIPESWEWVRVEDICTKLVDGDHNPPRGVDEKTDYIMASSTNINNNTIDSSSNAARVFWSTRGRSLYEQMLIEQNAIKELLLYIYKNQRDSGVFRLLNHMESLEMDDTLINDYLADLFEGKVNDWLIDYVDDMYEEIGDIKKIKERKKLLSLFGDRSVYFDFEDLEDGENES